MDAAVTTNGVGEGRVGRLVAVAATLLDRVPAADVVVTTLLVVCTAKRMGRCRSCCAGLCWCECGAAEGSGQGG